MFGKLEKSDIPHIEAYMIENAKTAIYLRQPVDQFKKGLLQGTLYGYVREQSLIGLFYFSNKRSLILHFSDAIVLGNMNVLKAFKHHAPKYVKGEYHQMQAFYKIICRAVGHIREDLSLLMAYEGLDPLVNTDLPYEVEDDQPIETSVINEHLNFFVKVEQAFGRNVQSVQDIQKNIEELVKNNQHCFVKDGDRMIAQGIVEEETGDMIIIGGIYVDPKYRKQAIGRHISIRLTQKGLDKNKSVYLFVMKHNTAAKALYEAIGFETIAEFSIFTVDT